MGWNGSGVVTRDNGTNSGANTWENDRDASIKITAENHDTHDQDLADAIQNTIAKDGQNFPTADLPMNNQKHTGVGAATAATHYARADQVQNGAFMWGGTAAGTADAITFNLTPTLTAYTTGLTVRFLANGTTTVTNPTININAAGAKTVKDQDGNALSVGDIASGTIYEASYDGTDFRIYVAASQDLSNYVTGPASTTENNVPQWDSTTKQLKDGLAVGSGSGSLLRTDGDGSSLTGVTDQTARTMAIVAIIEADVGGGVYGPIVSYDFSTDSLATSTNATHNTGYYENATESQIAQGTGSTLGNMTLSGGLAAAFDGTDHQTTANSAVANSSATGYVGKDWGSGVTKSLTQAKVFSTSDNGFYLNNGNSVSLTLEGSTDNFSSSVVELGSTTTTDTSNSEVTITASVTTAYRYHRIKIVTESPNAKISEVQFFEIAGPTEMTLIPSAVTLDAASPTDVSLYVNVMQGAGADVSADVQCRMSIDGGSTYTTAAVADEEYSFGSDLLLRFDADVSGQTGSSFVWEITTANNGEIFVYEPRCVPIY